MFCYVDSKHLWFYFHSRYAVFLLILVASLGGILQEQGIKVTSHSQRDFIDITKQALLVETNFTGDYHFYCSKAYVLVPITWVQVPVSLTDCHGVTHAHIQELLCMPPSFILVKFPSWPVPMYPLCGTCTHTHSVL